MHNMTFPPDVSIYVNASFSMLIMLVAIPGNIAMIAVFIHVKEVRDLNNTAITFLSCSDVTRACVVMSLKIYNQLTFATVLVGPACTISALVGAFTLVFSPMTLAMIGVVRYCKIVPWTNRSIKLSHSKLYIAAVIVFLVATAFSLLPVIGVGEYSYSPAHGVCFTDWRHKNEIFRTIFYILVIGLAFPVLSVCYILLFRDLHKHNKKFAEDMKEESRPREGSNMCPTDATAEHNNIIYNANEDVAVIVSQNCQNGSKEKKEETGDSPRPNERKGKLSVLSLKEMFALRRSPTVPKESKEAIISQQRARMRIFKQERQVTRLLMIIFVAYCLCWMPAAVINALALYHKKDAHKRIPLINFYVIVTMVELKAALNPLIYGLGNRKYRKAIKNIFKTLCSISSQQD